MNMLVYNEDGVITEDLPPEALAEMKAAAKRPGAVVSFRRRPTYTWEALSESCKPAWVSDLAYKIVVPEVAPTSPSPTVNTVVYNEEGVPTNDLPPEALAEMKAAAKRPGAVFSVQTKSGEWRTLQSEPLWRSWATYKVEVPNVVLPTQTQPEEKSTCTDDLFEQLIGIIACLANGTKHDPSWMSPVRLTFEERKSLFCDTKHIIDELRKLANNWRIQKND